MYPAYSLRHFPTSSKMSSPWSITLMLFIPFFTQYTSGWQDAVSHYPTYRLTEPVRIAVESDQGMVTSYLYPGQHLRTEDPNNNFICRQFLDNDYSAFLVPPTQQHVFKRAMPSYVKSNNYPYGNQLARYLSSLGYDGKPWVIFLKSKNVQIPSRDFDRVLLRSLGARNDWEIGALSITPAEEKDDIGDVDYPDEAFPAPPPIYQTLCVGPEYPKPYPGLYAFPPNTALRPSLTLFNFGDLSPAAITKITK